MFDHVTIRVSDRDASERFYRTVLATLGWSRRGATSATASGTTSRSRPRIGEAGRYGISVERLLTDNGSAYVSPRHAFACRRLGLRHLRTRPLRPQTNGKAERFIRPLLAGWAYGAIYRSSAERTAALDGWLWHYNHRRGHAALGRRPPASRTNPLGSYN